MGYRVVSQYLAQLLGEISRTSSKLMDVAGFYFCCFYAFQFLVMIEILLSSQEKCNSY